MCVWVGGLRADVLQPLQPFGGVPKLGCLAECSPRRQGVRVPSSPGLFCYLHVCDGAKKDPPVHFSVKTIIYIEIVLFFEIKY